jgi:hypothetical protein
MSAIRRLGWFLVGVLLVGVPMVALAGGVVVYDSQAGKLTPAGQLYKDTHPQPRSYTGSAGAGGASVEVQTPTRHVITGGRVPVTVDNVVKQKVNAAQIGKLGVGVLRGSIQGMVVTSAVTAAFDLAGLECDLTGCRVKAVPESCPGGVCTTAATAVSPYAVKTYRNDVNTGFSTAAAACTSAAWNVGLWCQSNPVQGQVISEGAATFQCRKYNACGYDVTQTLSITHSCPQGGTVQLQGGEYKCAGGPAQYQCPAGQGWTLSGNQCTRQQCAAGLNRNPANGQCLAPASKTDDEASVLAGPYFSPADAENLVREIDQLGETAKIEAEPQEVTGPASVTSPEQTQTTKDANQQVTGSVTNTTTINNTYNQNTWNYSISNKTETKDAQGQTVDTKEETVDDSLSVNDSPLPEVPKLYTRKYPQGLQGVWNTQKAQLTASGLAGLQSVFVPTIAGGQCPSWTINANIGPHMNFGSGSVSPPCWIWDAIKVIFVITALFLARRLVFGG